jgi:hypothetical protein
LDIASDARRLVQRFGDGALQQGIFTPLSQPQATINTHAERRHEQ